MTRMWLKLAIAALVIWLLTRQRKAGAGVISVGGPDFDPLTASQLGGKSSCPTNGTIGCYVGGVTVGDDWSATFITGNGNWSDAYRSHATENADVEPGGIPL
mgnify:CR=1 FL=1